MRLYCRSIARFFGLNLLDARDRSFLYDMLSYPEFQCLAIEASFNAVFRSDNAWYHDYEISKGD